MQQHTLGSTKGTVHTSSAASQNTMTGWLPLYINAQSGMVVKVL
jgi:hypothetical protein